MNNLKKKTPERIILYYPRISIPTGKWLRHALLYWDMVASIVPLRYDGTEVRPYSTDIEFLKNEGEFRPIRPESLITHQAKLEDFEEEFNSILYSQRFKNALLPTNNLKLDCLIHRNKISKKIYYLLEKQGLAKDTGDPDWYSCDEQTAHLYMGILAKYLAKIDVDFMVPGTDRSEFQDLNFQAISKEHSFICFTTEFQNIFPVPAENVSLTNIITFKRKRREELLNFRNVIDGFKSDLGEVKDNSDLKYILVKHKELIEKNCLTLQRIFKDSAITTTGGVIKNLLNIKSPTFLTTIGAAAGKVTKLADMPLEWIGLGMGAMGIIQVGTYLIDKSNERKGKMLDSSYSYVFSAKTEGII